MGIRNYAGVTNDLDVATKKYVDDGVASVRQVPASTSADEGKVLGIVDSNDTLGWMVPAVQQELRYAIVTPTTATSTTDSADDTISATLQDRAVNTLSPPAGTKYVNVSFPSGENGLSRDFMLRIVAADSSISSVSFSDGGDAASIELGMDDLADWGRAGSHLVLFTEVADGVFLAGRRFAVPQP